MRAKVLSKGRNGNGGGKHVTRKQRGDNLGEKPGKLQERVGGHKGDFMAENDESKVCKTYLQTGSSSLLG